MWLYGSRARGDHHQNSDIDLAIVTVGQNVDERFDCWVSADWRDELSLTQEDDLEWYDPDEELIAVGPGVESDGILLYRR